VQAGREVRKEKGCSIMAASLPVGFTSLAPGDRMARVCCKYLYEYCTLRLDESAPCTLVSIPPGTIVPLESVESHMVTDTYIQPQQGNSTTVDVQGGFAGVSEAGLRPFSFSESLVVVILMQTRF
jgi:hypothetical protein